MNHYTKAVFDLTESRFSFIVNPNLDSQQIECSGFVGVLKTYVCGIAKHFRFRR